MLNYILSRNLNVFMAMFGFLAHICFCGAFIAFTIPYPSFIFIFLLLFVLYKVFSHSSEIAQNV